MTPEQREDSLRVELDALLGNGPSSPSSPSSASQGAAAEARQVSDTVSTARPRPRPGRLRRSFDPLVRLKGRRTILDTPQEEAERKPPVETVVVGWTGAIISHSLLVLLLLLLVFLLPKEKEPVAFDTELGSAFGDEEGLDLIGGFDDTLELSDEVEEEDSRIFEPIAIEDLATGIDVSTELVQTDPSRSEVGGSTGLGGGEFGAARFGEGLETIRGVDDKVGDPQFTLIWDTMADIDLHVVEPGGSHIYWAHRQGKRGGELDVDDTDGFGPENIYWLDPESLDGEKVKGQGPEGFYHWYVHYYASPRGFGGKAVPTRWKVRVKHKGEVTVFEGVLRRVNERGSIRKLRVGSPSGVAASDPEPSEDLDSRPDFDFEDDDS